MPRWPVDDNSECLPVSSTILERAVSRTSFAATSRVSPDAHTQMRRTAARWSLLQPFLWNRGGGVPTSPSPPTLYTLYFFLFPPVRAGVHTNAPPRSVGRILRRRSSGRTAGDAVLEMSLRRAHPGQFEEARPDLTRLTRARRLGRSDDPPPRSSWRTTEYAAAAANDAVPTPVGGRDAGTAGGPAPPRSTECCVLVCACEGGNSCWVQRRPNRRDISELRDERRR